MTSRQIYQILIHRNIDIKSQDKLNNKYESRKTNVFTFENERRNDHDEGRKAADRAD